MPTTPIAIEALTPWGTFRTTLDVPEGVVRPVALVPVMRALAEAVVAHVHEAVRPQVSCRAGCGACCRQLVPVAEPELHAIAELVATQPESRRRDLEARFAATRRALDDAGLTPRILSPPTDHSAYRELVRDYFRAAVPCPFLEDESCGIHDVRPTICREYSVTSPAAHCADPFGMPVAVVPVPVCIGSVFAIALGEVTAQRVKITPLPFALDWVAAHPDRLGLVPAGRVVARVVEILVESLGELRARASDGSLGEAPAPVPGSASPGATRPADPPEASQ